MHHFVDEGVNLCRTIAVSSNRQPTSPAAPFTTAGRPPARPDKGEGTDGRGNRKIRHRKVYMRLLPFAILSYFLAYIDRINVSFAGLTMRGDLDMSATAFGLAATSTKLCHIALWNGGVRQRGE